MPNRDFIPTSAPKLREWLNNLTQGAVNKGLLDPNEERLLAAYAAEIISQQDVVAQNERALSESQNDYEQLLEQRLPSLRDLVNRIKKSDNYNPGIGNGLDIITQRGSATDWDSMKPVLKLKTTATMVQIGYARYKSDGVRVFCKRGNEPEFSLVGHNTASPFEDSRPNLAGNKSEKREYYLVYVKKNRIVGLASDIVTANVSFLQP